jgi:glycosyltransferase involved in cell wall biosynthesis
MKLALLLRSLHMGGAERQAVELCRAMSERGHDVTILTMYSGGELLEEARDRGIKLIDLRRRGSWDFIVFLARLAMQIRKQQPDVLYSFGDIPNLAAVLIRPFIIPCRVAWGLRNNMTFESSDRYGRLLTLVMPRLSAFTDLIIANSHVGRNEALRQGFRATNFYVLGNCINTQKFVLSHSQRKTFREKIGVASGDVLIGNVGIRSGKGTADFLQAAATVSRERQNLKLLIVGKDAARSTPLSQLIESLELQDRTISLNVTTDVGSIYNAIDVLCSASYGEGFPNVIAEAMSCGKPCVVTDVGESAEIVGPHGTVVPPGEPTLLAEGLAKAVDDLNRFGDQETIRRRIVEKFSSGAVAKKTEELLRTSVS